MKQKMKNALIVITIVGLLGVAVSASGCATPTRTSMSATWLPGVSVVPLMGGGLKVSGQLLGYPYGPTGIPIAGVQVNLTASSDLNAQNTVVLKTCITDARGNYAFTISQTQDKYLLYVTSYGGGDRDPNGSPYAAALGSVVAGYHGIDTVTNRLMQNVTKLQTSAFGSGGKVQLLTWLSTAKMEVQLGQYGGARTYFDQVLVKMDQANATKGAPSALVNMDYSAYLLAKNCHWLSGVPWAMPERSAPSGYLL